MTYQTAEEMSRLIYSAPKELFTGESFLNYMKKVKDTNMSDIIKKINADKIAAMKSGDKTLKDTLSLVQAAIKQVEVDTRKELTEVEVIQILSKMVKQRVDSITQYTNAGRLDLANVEESEKEIIIRYIPVQMTEEEIRFKVAELISPTDNIGQAMGKAKSVFAGKADMGLVSKVVKDFLQG